MARKLKYYKPDVGDEFVEVQHITPALKDRIFEARDQATGEGVRGKLVDAEHYMLNGIVMIRFEGEKLGIPCNPDDRILLKAEGFAEVQS